MPRLRVLLLVTFSVALGLASFWPLRGRWSAGRAAERWEDALLELRFPFLSVSDRAERSVLKAQIGPLEPRREHHLVIIRGGPLRLWVDGRTVVNLLNAPPNTLVWSSHQRLWIGGAPGDRGRTARVRRVAFYDRLLAPEEVRRLHRAGWRAPLPEELGEPALVLSPAAGSPRALLTGAGRAGPVTLLLPPDAVPDSAGLWLTGSSAVSTAPAARLAELVRRSQAVTVEIWLELPQKPESGRHPVLAIAEPGGETNLRVELGQSDAEILVRAAYPSLRRVWDCVLNFAGYAPLGLVLAWGRRSGRAWGGALLLGGGLSLAVEILQSVSPDRTPSFIDLAANSLGALGGAVLASLLTDRR